MGSFYATIAAGSTADGYIVMGADGLRSFAKPWLIHSKPFMA